MVLMKHFESLSEKIYFYCICIVAGVLLYKGVVWSPDATTFSGYADRLIACDFQLSCYNSGLDSHNKQLFFYMIPVLILAFLKELLPDFWQVAAVLLNGVFLLGALAILRKWLLAMMPNKTAVYGIMALFLFHHDSWFWVSYVQTDMLFFFGVTLHFRYIFNYLIEGPSQRVFWRVLASAVFLAMIKTHGFIIAGLSLLTLAVYPLYRSLLQQPWRLLSFLTFITLGSFGLNAIMLAYPGFIASDFLNNFVSLNRFFFDQGVVMHGRLETYHNAPVDVFDYLWIMIDRWITFFGFIAQDWSLAHKLMSAGFFVPLYIGMLMALYSFFQGRLHKGGRMLMGMSLFYTFAIACFCSATILDYSWRYRLSVLPLWLMLSATGWLYLYHSAKDIWKNREVYRLRLKSLRS